VTQQSVTNSMKIDNLTIELQKIITFLSINKNLEFSHPQLAKISKDKIDTPIGDALEFFSDKKSKLSNNLIDLELLEKLIDQLTKINSLIRLSHIGFCYKVPSTSDEKIRITNLVKKSNLHLYQEESNDDGLWLFVGNADKWEEPVIELLPIESTDDEYVEYWLPHIQIDIDTNLTGKEIDKIVRSIFGEKIIPYFIKIDGTTYIIRNRLGVIDGVNIFLDLATNSRKVQYSRQELWKKIV